MAETRTFTVNPAIIRHLISSQAGTLEKALGESVMNSIDAGASKVEINLTNTGLSIVDDGCGFKTREEVLACFEVFGFEHNDKERVFGQFGLGRAQIWNWASTVWRTHQFALDVDIRARGLDYELADDKEDLPGMTIEGSFYDRLPETERQSCIRGLEKLCKYCVIPVVVNGRNVQRDPGQVKWTYEDENCWIKKGDGWGVDIYNQGILVRSYSSSEVGISGAIVTKRGKVLALSMSRTDVLTQTCKLWPKIKAAAAKLVDVEIRSGKTRMTDEKRDFLARATLTPKGCIGFDEMKVFTLTNGRNESLESLMKKLVGYRGEADMILTTAPVGDRLADRAMSDRIAVVLAPRTLSRFDVGTVEGLVKCLLERLACQAHTWAYKRLEAFAQSDQTYESLDDSPYRSKLHAATVPIKDWTPVQWNVIVALAQVNSSAALLVSDHTGVAYKVRDLTVGISNAAEAFTDGESYVAIEASVVDEIAKSGLPGMLRAANLLVHEYLHNDDDSGSHVHDMEFYEAFHEVVLDGALRLYDAGLRGFQNYCRSVERMNRKLARQVDAMKMDVAA